MGLLMHGEGLWSSVYLRIELTNGTVFTHLVSSKTRVAPISGDNIPRLELVGGLIHPD